MKLGLPKLVRVCWLGRVRHVREQRLLVHRRGRDDLGRGHLLHRRDGLLLLLGVKVALMVTWHLELGLDLPELPPGQHLDVATHLLPRPRLAGPELDVPGDQLVPPVHLALVREDNLPPAAGRVDGQRLLEALLNVRSPDTLGVCARDLLVVIKLGAVVLGNLLTDGLTHPGQSHGVTALHGQGGGRGRDW